MDELGKGTIFVKRKESQLIGMDSVTDTCKYEYQCFVTNTGQGHLLSSGKKGQTKTNREMALQHMFLGQIFEKNTKNDPKTLSEN